MDKAQESDFTIKCVLVGDGTVGKTSIVMSYAHSEFPDSYTPTVFDNCSVVQKAENKSVNINLWDTAGQEEYERLRPVSYPGTDVFLLCFSVDSPASLERISTHWHPEVSHHCPDGKIVLVGNKIDLRTNAQAIENQKSRGVNFISFNQGKEKAEEIGAFDYVECSAKTKTGLTEAFQVAINALGLLKPPKKAETGKKKSGCLIL